MRRWGSRIGLLRGKIFSLYNFTIIKGSKLVGSRVQLGVNVESACQRKVPVNKDANQHHRAKKTICEDFAVKVSQFGEE